MSVSHKSIHRKDCGYRTRNEDLRGFNNKNKQHLNLFISHQSTMSLFLLHFHGHQIQTLISRHPKFRPRSPQRSCLFMHEKLGVLVMVRGQGLLWLRSYSKGHDLKQNFDFLILNGKVSKYLATFTSEMSSFFFLSNHLLPLQSPLPHCLLSVSFFFSLVSPFFFFHTNTFQEM